MMYVIAKAMRDQVDLATRGPAGRHMRAPVVLPIQAPGGHATQAQGERHTRVQEVRAIAVRGERDMTARVVQPTQVLAAQLMRVQADLATTAQVAPATQVLAAEGIAHPSVNDLGLAERNSLSALILVSHG